MNDTHEMKPNDPLLEVPAGDAGAEPQADVLDPANQSLADALRISFTLLKLAMLVLAVIFLLSNLRNVDEGKVAVGVVFGAVVGEPGRQVMRPGGPYWLWPEPIGRFIEVDTTERRISLETPFWYQINPSFATMSREQIEQRFQTGLRVGYDGSLLTGDQNIVHARFNVGYVVRAEGAVRFVTNISADPQIQRMRETADRLVTSVAESAIVNAVAGITADEFLRSGIANTSENDRYARLTRDIQTTLDDLGSGITITGVSIADQSPPLPVALSFRDVTNANSERATKISEANQEASRILIAAAGKNWQPLVEAIENYEDALALGEAERAGEAEAEINRLLSPEQAEGDVAVTISSADQYRSTISQKMQAEARLFESLLPSYELNPGVELNRLWQQTLSAILSADTEVVFLGESAEELVIDFTRDPRLSDERQSRQFQREIEAQKGSIDYSEASIQERMRIRREREDTARRRDEAANRPDMN